MRQDDTQNRGRVLSGKWESRVGEGARFDWAMCLGTSICLFISGAFWVSVAYLVW